MWQREAMWLNFQQGSYKYAVRVFVDHVNAITGQEMQKGLDTKDESKLQDYVVIPGQEWLDGICIAPGIVRQFVAMSFDNKYRNDGLKESYTPRELGCKIGDILRSYPTDTTYRTPFWIQDLVTPEVEKLSENKLPYNVDLSSVAPVKLKADGGTLRMAFERECLKETSDVPLPARSHGEPPSILWNHVQLVAPIQPRRAKMSIRNSERYDFQSREGIDEGITMHAKTESEGKKGLIELTETQVKNIKTMGLAAGGKLIQDIYKDRNPATIWNHATARILYVHMLDPESCEKVTHIVP
ncbi:hypothetical protein GGP41_003381 [Bipolaris sorokiniana]|uniref:Uncharacterized protein n=1 Tax=Cochliobolus sativus TaxID=45130 RepID=A0A8H5ZE98_COCSA|nr:hypothetical protein GGP41_003381 [Bipolaris sorokiniana]